MANSNTSNQVTIHTTGINANQLRNCIVIPTIKEIGLWSQVAENLIMGTAAQESGCGQYIKQTKGPALGIYQCEPHTHDLVWVWVQKTKPQLYASLAALLGKAALGSARLVYDLRYATVVCRLHYLAVSKPLPSDANDIPALAAYYKKYYNTPSGAATVQEFIHNYARVS